MNDTAHDITVLRQAAPEAPPLTTETRYAARAALMAEIDGGRPRGLSLIHI